jgi:hypothetical protein
MQDASSTDGAEGADLRDLEAIFKSLDVSPASLRLLHRNCDGYIKRYVFEACLSRHRSALKCFVHPEDDINKRSDVEKEVAVAEWAAQQQLGAPVHGVVRTPNVTVLVMAMALVDFEAVLRSCHQLSYTLVRELFDQAFRIVTHERLVARGLVCSDLKPANILVHATRRTCSAFGLAAFVKGNVRKGLRVELRLADFDPFFWSEAVAEDVALLNGFFLLANCVLWKTAVKLGPYMPAEAVKLAEAVRSKQRSLTQALRKHPRLLRSGPLHYSRMPPGKKASLNAFLEELSEALTRHGL